MSEKENEQNDEAEENNKKKNELSVSQKVRMERNRQRALLLRSSRLMSHPYAPPESDGVGKAVHVGGSRVIDSGGGFFIEEEDEEEVLVAADLPQLPGKIYPPVSKNA